MQWRCIPIHQKNGKNVRRRLTLQNALASLRSEMALILFVIVLSGCQGLVDSNNKLALFNAPNSNGSQNFQDDDLWGYIANNQEINFGLNTRIQNHIDWISTQPDYLASISKRAEPFLYLVVSETERQGVPIELALLPIVESDYYPFHTLMERQRGYGNSFPLLERCMA